MTYGGLVLVDSWVCSYVHVPHVALSVLDSLHFTLFLTPIWLVIVKRLYTMVVGNFNNDNETILQCL